MTVHEARAAFSEAILESIDLVKSEPIKFSRHRVEYTENSGKELVVLAKVEDLRVEEKSVPLEPSKYFIYWKAQPQTGSPDGVRLVVLYSKANAMKFAEALAALRAAALAPDTEDADFAAFSALLKAPRPEMTPEARTFKALAEEAFKKKDFATALEAYLEALGKHPMWPEGHYNAALLAAEVEDFELAAKHMRRYLALAPEAKDAAAAEEKYLLWRHKSKP